MLLIWLGQTSCQSPQQDPPAEGNSEIYLRQYMSSRRSQLIVVYSAGSDGVFRMYPGLVCRDVPVVSTAMPNLTSTGHEEGARLNAMIVAHNRRLYNSELLAPEWGCRLSRY